MRNLAAANIIQNAKKTTRPSDYEIANRIKYIDIVVEYIRKVAKEQNFSNKKDLKEFILNELYEEIEEYCKIAGIYGRFFQIEAARRILEDKSIIESVYDSVKDDERFTEEYNGPKKIIYNSNFRNNCRNLVGEYLCVSRMLESRINPQERELIERYSRASNSEKKIMEKKLTGVVDIENLKLLSELLQGNIVDNIYNQIKVNNKNQEEQLKQNLIKIMQYLYSKFKEYGFLERYKKNNDRNMSTLGLDGYTYELSTGKYSKDEIGIEELFSIEFLEQLELEDIIMLSTFWQNRYSKEKMSIGEAIFAIDTLELWERILDGDTIEVSDEEIEGIYNKIKCVKNLCSSLFNNIKGKKGNVVENHEDEGFQIFDDTSEIAKIVNQESENYRKTFREILETSKNDLYEDIMGYKPILNHVENIYQTRNSILGCEIRLLLNSKKCKNWGIIQENKKNNNNPYVLIGIDYEGFNMPIRLHIKKDLLIELLREYSKETKVPIYEGDKDFIINGELIPTNILMPLQRKQQSFIREEFLNIEEDSDRTRFIRHLRFLSNHDKYPEHLKVETHKSKDKKKTRPPRKYIDLDTGKIFEKVNGEYVEILEGRGEDDGINGR